MKIRTCIDCRVNFEGPTRGRPALRCEDCKRKVTRRRQKQQKQRTFTVEVTCATCKGAMVERNATRNPGFIAAVLVCQDCSRQMMVRFEAYRVA